MARYNGAMEEVVQLLTAKPERRGGGNGREKEEFHASKKGVRYPSAFCDMCLFVQQLHHTNADKQLSSLEAVQD